MPPNLPRRIRWLSAKLGFERDWYLVLMAAVIGVVMGGVATAFILPLRWLEHAAETLGTSGGWINLLVVAVVPVIGALLAGQVLRWHSGAGGGPGVTTVMYAIHRSKSRLPLKAAATKWLASTLTIGSGGSAGAEGPIVTIGGVIGSSIGGLLRTTPQNTATLLGCGAAAGIASVFNAPIAGIFFVLEVLLRDFSLRTFTPIVIASVISTTWTQTMLGTDEPLFGLDPADILVSKLHFSLPEVPNVLLLGVVCGISAPLFIRALYWTEGLYERLPLHRVLKPATGAALLGLLGVAYLVLAPRALAFHNVPPFYGNGYPVVTQLLSPGTYFRDSGHTQLLPVSGLLPLLLLVTLMKGAATCLTIGSGGSGGLFAPSLLLGAGLGGAVGVVANAVGWFPANPAAYALLGMAAMVASLAHAPLTGILLAYEITRLYQLVLPLMLVAVIGTIVARLILPESVYTLKLARMGVQIGAMSDLTILRRLSMQDVPLAAAVTLHSNDSAQRLLDLSETNAASDFVVIDDDNNYAGMITGADLRAALVYREAIPLLQVSELLRTDLPTVQPDETLDIVLGKFSRHEVQSLAVLEATAGAGKPGGRRVLGLITRARLMQHYQAALSRD